MTERLPARFFSIHFCHIAEGHFFWSRKDGHLFLFLKNRLDLASIWYLLDFFPKTSCEVCSVTFSP